VSVPLLRPPSIGTRIVAALAAAVLLHATKRVVDASALIAMSNGAADMSLNGTTIAEPLTPSGALFANPAGLCGFEQTTLTGSLGYGFGVTRIDNDAGYSQDDDLWAIFPDAAIAFPGRGRWTYGVGMYGSVGMNYDFEADPAAGVNNDFHAEASIGELPLAVAYRVRNDLYVGMEVIALFGHLRNRYTLSDQLFKYTLRGPGVQGQMGLTWKPFAQWSVGVGVRTPGRIWMDGSTAVPASIRRDVDLELQMPTQVSIGVTHRASRRVTVSASGRWTDSSGFGDSDISFGQLPAANVPFVPAADDEWRGALGVQIEPKKGWFVRLGASHSTHIVATRGVSPLVYDNTDNRVSFGLGVELGRWSVDTMAGYSFNRTRNVDAGEALVIPGRFESGGGIVMIGWTRRL
jgi:long-subunit fatty acid transport protein